LGLAKRGSLAKDIVHRAGGWRVHVCERLPLPCKGYELGYDKYKKKGTQTYVLELSNIDSAPKCDVPPRARPLFILAFVCTTGTSSVFCALGDMIYEAKLLSHVHSHGERDSRYVVLRTAYMEIMRIDDGVRVKAHHHITWLVLGPRLPKGISESSAKRATSTCAGPGMARALRMWVLVGMRMVRAR